MPLSKHVQGDYENMEKVFLGLSALYCYKNVITYYTSHRLGLDLVKKIQRKES